MDNMNQLILNLDKLHTTDLGQVRIKRNLCIGEINVVEWCREKIYEPHCKITRKGKNWYAVIDNMIITINAHSYTIITAHKKPKRS